jgi:hypothetical protein
MRKRFIQWFSLPAAIFMLATFLSNAEAAPTATEITGEIEHLTLKTPTDIYSAGVMIVGGHEVILPRNLLIDLPANRLTLQQIFDQAPAACKALGESGLAKADRCNASGTGGFATLSGVHSNAGNVIAGDVLIEKGKEVVSGVVSYINFNDGYFRVNGIPNDPNTGVMVRLNDPTSRHTVQQGTGCAGGPNCSPDPRFTLDPENYVIAFSSGYPVCIPSTVPRNFTSIAGLAISPAQSSPTGTGDALCPDTNRTPGLVVEPPVNDSRLFAPLVVGDSVNAEGNYETVNSVRFLSTHTMRVNKALATKNLPTQPDYLFLEEVFIEAPGFQNQRARALLIGFTTLAPTDVDFWSIHRDPGTNSIHEFPLASVQGCDNAPGNGLGTCSNQGLVGAGANIFRIRYDVDFLMAAQGFPGGTKDAKLNPCKHLQASPRFRNLSLCTGSGSEFADNFAVMSPIPHEIQARTGHSLDNPGLITLDINGRQATNGQYLFPLGMNLGGIETADFLEIDVNLLNTPRAFEGIPWNLDRRLSPSGCLAGGCEATPQPLDPFPYTGLDPRLQAEFLVAGLPGGTPKGPFSDPNFTASTLSNASNRVFSFVDPVSGKFNGNNTLLPYALGTFPADPPFTPINPTPALTIFAPIALDDSVVTDKNTPAPINVISNDVAVFGAIDQASVQIVTTPAHGQLSAVLGGSVTYTPTPGYSGSDSFTYKVASVSGGGISGVYSNVATVSIVVVAPPAATNDTVTTFTSAPQFAINVIANDSPGTSPINPASVNIVSNADCVGGTATLPNPENGTILFTAPNTAGICQFSYTVSDSTTPPRISNVATVTVTVNPVNTPPVANPDTAFTTFGSTITINVLANDTTTSALDPATLSISGTTGGATVTPNANGTVQYAAPAVVGVGPYTFNYTVKDVTGTQSNSATVVVTLVSPPTAGADSATMSGGAGTSTLIDVLATDSAVAPATLVPASVAIVSAPVHGSVSINPADGKVTYYPNPGYVGGDSFTYSVKDSLGVVSNTATVTVTVNTPATESLTVTTAQYIVSTDTWQIDGTTTNRGLNVVEVFNSPTVGTGSLGTASVDANGNWSLTASGKGAPNGQLQISVQSVTDPAVLWEGITLVVR